MTAGFPGVGPVGSFSVNDFVLGTQGAQVNSDGGLTVGGNLLYNILAELRVQTQLLANISNQGDNIIQMRSDAIMDFTLATTYPITLISSD